MDFSDSEEDKLINQVAQYPALYDASHKNYVNTVIKDHIWKKIGEDLNKSGAFHQRTVLSLCRNNRESCEQMTFVDNSALNWNSLLGNNGIYANRNMTGNNRKRRREDDTCDFMPLSKRINNLHLNSSLSNTAMPQVPETSHNGLSLENGISSPDSSSDSDQRPSYNPGISSADSSYYFNNKLLFELHLERMQRTGQQYPY